MSMPAWARLEPQTPRKAVEARECPNGVRARRYFLGSTLSSGVYFSLNAFATAASVTLPFSMLIPVQTALSAFAALTQPMSAILTA